MTEEKKSTKKYCTITILIFTTLICLSFAYTYYINYNLQSTLNEQQQETKSLLKSYENFKTMSLSDKNQNERWLNTIKNITEKIENTKKNPYTIDQWQEVLFSIRMSYFHLIFLSNKYQAIQWLQTAQEILNSIQSQSAVSANKYLQDLTHEIQNLPSINKQQLLLKLEEIQKKAETISTIQKTKDINETNKEDNKENKKINWQDYFTLNFWKTKAQNAGNNLSSLLKENIKIYTLTSSHQLYLDPPTIQAFQILTRVLIEQAQWAILYNETTIYQNSLKKLSTAIDNFFTKDIQQSDLQKEIQELIKTPITINYPNYNKIIENLSNNLSAQNQLPKGPETSTTNISPNTEDSKINSQNNLTAKTILAQDVT